MYWPAGTPDNVKRPASSVRALTFVFWTATSTAPAGKPFTRTATRRSPGIPCAAVAAGAMRFFVTGAGAHYRGGNNPKEGKAAIGRRGGAQRGTGEGRPQRGPL